MVYTVWVRVPSPTPCLCAPFSGTYPRKGESPLSKRAFALSAPGPPCHPGVAAPPCHPERSEGSRLASQFYRLLSAYDRALANPAGRALTGLKARPGLKICLFHGRKKRSFPEDHQRTVRERAGSRSRLDRIQPVRSGKGVNDAAGCFSRVYLRL